jgi:hypothetical protein
MGEFARVIQPHLEGHDIDGAEDLARQLRAAGVHRGAPEVRRWMEGEPGHAGPRDLVAMESIFDLSEEEVAAVWDAFSQDVRANMEARRREQ